VTAIGLSLAILAGLVLAVARPVEPRVLGLAVVGAVAALALSWHGAGLRALALAVLAAALAALRVALWPSPSSDALNPLVGSDVLVVGHVQSDPTRAERSGSLALRVRAVGLIAGPGPPVLAPVDARVGVVVGPDDPALGLDVGAAVAATGRLSRPPPTAGALGAEQLRRKGIYSVLTFPRLGPAVAGPAPGGVEVPVPPAEAPMPRAGAPGPLVEAAPLVVRAASAGAVAPAEPSLVGGAPRAASDLLAAAGLQAARLRQAGMRAIHAFVPDPAAALAAGMVLGGSNGLDPGFRGQLQASGLAHLVSVDGYKQVLVTSAVGALAVRALGRRLSLGPTLAAIVAYTAVTGASAAAVRAGLMAGGAAVAASVGRLADPLTSVLAAAAAMALVDPDLLRDASYQMSVGATLGLVLLYPRLGRALAWLPPWVGEQLGLSLAVSLATLPVTLALFREVSLVSPLAHVVAMPLVGPIMLASAALVATAWCPPVATALGWVVWLLTAALVAVVRAAAAAPGASLSTGRLPPAATLMLGAAIVAWGVSELPEAAALAARLTRVAGWHRARKMAALVAVPLAAALGLWVVRPDGRLHVYLLQSGRGQAALIRGPTGATLLVLDGTVDGRALPDQVGASLPAWEHTLGGVVTLAPDRPAGLGELVRRYPPAVALGADDARLDLGGGAAVDLYASPGPGAAVRYGDVWVRLSGRPPPPADAQLYDAADLGQAGARGASWSSGPSPASGASDPAEASRTATALPVLSRSPRPELVTDGTSAWLADP
jgi:ComEC/Rec2-related protein